MIDTVHIQITTDRLPENYYITQNSTIKIESIKFDADTEQYTYYGSVNNLSIIQNYRGLYIQGSLSKYWFSTNQKTLFTDDIANAVNQLSQQLELDVCVGKITRLDLAANLILTKPINTYYQLLTEAKYLKRIPLRNGIEYRSTARTLTFYDKVKDVKRRRETLTDVFQSRNVLRVEYRLLKHDKIAEVLNLSFVTILDILNSFGLLIAEWKKTVDSVDRNYDVTNFHPEVFGIKGGLDRQLKIIGIKSIGGISTLKTMIKNAQASGLFTGYIGKADTLIRNYKELMRSPVLTIKSDQLNELEDKINTAYQLNLSADRCFA